MSLKKMNSLKVLFSLLILGSFAACSPSAQISTASPSPTAFFPATSTARLFSLTPTEFVIPPGGTPIPTDYWQRLINVSPDGNWKVNIGQSIAVTSISGNITMLDEKPDLEPYYEFQTWFPDSSGFILFDAPTGCEKCSFDRLVIYQMDQGQQKLRHYILAPGGEKNSIFYTDVSMSPEGSRLAVITNDRQIDIINRKAEVVQVFHPVLDKNEVIVEVDWTNFGLLFTAAQGSSNLSDIRVEIRKIDVTNADYPDTTVYRSIGSTVAIESINPSSPLIILRITLFVSPPSVWSKHVIYNISTQNLGDSLCEDNQQVPECEIINSADQQYFAIKSGDQGDNLFIYNWSTLELAKKNIHIDRIIKWEQSLHSFIVEVGNDPNYWLEAITP
jgi:hypothetical protein